MLIVASLRSRIRASARFRDGAMVLRIDKPVDLLTVTVVC
jgi:hypothetical protein